MAFPNNQFFLDRFVSYNKDRYKDETEFVKSLNALSLDDVTFKNRRKDTNQDGTPFYLVDMSSPNLFIAGDQQYTPGDYIHNGPSVLVDETPLAMSDLQNRFVPGIYKLQIDPNTIGGAVLVKSGEKTNSNIIQLVKDSCLFELEEAEITLDSGLENVTIDSYTVIGKLAIVESINSGEEALYDGEYLYDGTLTY